MAREPVPGLGGARRAAAAVWQERAGWRRGGGRWRLPGVWAPGRCWAPRGGRAMRRCSRGGSAGSLGPCGAVPATVLAPWTKYGLWVKEQGWPWWGGCQQGADRGMTLSHAR